MGQRDAVSWLQPLGAGGAGQPPSLTHPSSASAPQDLWLPPPLHGCLQHRPRGSPEAAGEIMERPRHPAPLFPAQGLLCLRIASRASLVSLVKMHSSAAVAGEGRARPPDSVTAPFLPGHMLREGSLAPQGELRKCL